MEVGAGGSGWFSVRCVFAMGWPPEAQGRPYEERVTLWRAASLEEAIGLAEDEARAYAATITDSPDTYLGLAQAYRMVDEPRHGAEVFSLVRDSDLAAEDYLDTVFDTGREHQAEGLDAG